LTQVFALADDLTGALEIGAKFAGAVVTTRPAWEPGAAAQVVDTETRHLPAPQAGAVVRRLACEARELGARLVYKKTDSTLRGNIEAELCALSAAFPGSRVVYVPAYPQMGRTVVSGRLLVHGVPVHLTEFAHDPINPVSDSRVPAPAGVEVWDGETGEDVARAAERLMQAQAPVLAAGPAALAEAIAERMGSSAAASFPRVRRCLVVNGSLHPLSARQAWAVASDDDWVIWAERGPDVGRRVRELAHRFDGLFIFGGDTAFEVLQALDCTKLRPLGEIVPGVPVSLVEFGGRGLVLLTKAGGFGTVDIVPAVRRRL
jgi:D-threonate/D-erythronate kinase